MAILADYAPGVYVEEVPSIRKLTVTRPPLASITIRRRVSLAGRVTGPSGRLAIGGVVALQASPAVQVAKRPAKGAADRNTPVAAPSSDLIHRYEAHIRRDGYYFFLDLPPGDYVISGADERCNPIQTQPVSIVAPEGQRQQPTLGTNLISAAPPSSASDSRG